MKPTETKPTAENTYRSPAWLAARLSEGFSFRDLSSYLKKMGILISAQRLHVLANKAGLKSERKPYWQEMPPVVPTDPWHEEEWMTAAWREEKTSTGVNRRILQEFGVTEHRATTYRWLAKYGLYNIRKRPANLTVNSSGQIVKATRRRT